MEFNKVYLDDMDIGAMIDVLRFKQAEQGFTNCESNLLNYFIVELKRKGYSLEFLKSGESVFNHIYELRHDEGFEDKGDE